MSDPPTTKELGDRFRKLRTKTTRQQAALEASRKELAELRAEMETAIVTDIKDGRSVIEIANDTGYHRTRINQIRKAHGLAPERAGAG